MLDLIGLKHQEELSWKPVNTSKGAQYAHCKLRKRHAVTERNGKGSKPHLAQLMRASLLLVKYRPLHSFWHSKRLLCHTLCNGIGRIQNEYVKVGC